MSDDGIQNIITEKAYTEKLQIINEKDVKSKTSNGSSIQPYSVGDSYGYSSEDSLLKKALYIYETKNAAKGTFGIITTFEWKNYSIRYHGEEVLSHSAEHLSFARDSFNLSVVYKFLSYPYESTEYYGPNDFTDNELIGEQNVLYVLYNLKNNFILSTSPLVFTDASFMMLSSEVIDNDQLNTNFNVFGNYFHQKIGLGSVGVSVSADGASIDVSPKLSYTQCQIMTSSPIRYTAY